MSGATRAGHLGGRRLQSCVKLLADRHPDTTVRELCHQCRWRVGFRVTHHVECGYRWDRSQGCREKLTKKTSVSSRLQTDVTDCLSACLVIETQRALCPITAHCSMHSAWMPQMLSSSNINIISALSTNCPMYYVYYPSFVQSVIIVHMCGMVWA